jgi:hypothetical protein
MRAATLGRQGEADKAAAVMRELLHIEPELTLTKLRARLTFLERLAGARLIVDAIQAFADRVETGLRQRLGVAGTHPRESGCQRWNKDSAEEQCALGRQNLAVSILLIVGPCGVQER